MSGRAVVVATLDELAAGTAKRVEVESQPIALVRCGDEVRAIADRCSHADVALSEGEVRCDEGTIECWKHGSTFLLTTGEPTTLPATRPVAVYEVRVEDGKVSVVLP